MVTYISMKDHTKMSPFCHLQEAVMDSVSGLKALSVGRVVVVSNSLHLNALGVILQVRTHKESSIIIRTCHPPLFSRVSLILPCASLCQVSNDAVNRTFTTLIICEKGNEEPTGDTMNTSAPPHLYNTALFTPEGQLHTHTHTHTQ